MWLGLKELEKKSNSEEKPKEIIAYVVSYRQQSLVIVAGVAVAENHDEYENPVVFHQDSAPPHYFTPVGNWFDQTVT